MKTWTLTKYDDIYLYIFVFFTIIDIKNCCWELFVYVYYSEFLPLSKYASFQKVNKYLNTLLAQSFTTHIVKANLLQDISRVFFAFIGSLMANEFPQGNFSLRCLLNDPEETRFMS